MENTQSAPSMPWDDFKAQAPVSEGPWNDFRPPSSNTPPTTDKPSTSGVPTMGVPAGNMQPLEDMTQKAVDASGIPYRGLRGLATGVEKLGESVRAGEDKGISDIPSRMADAVKPDYEPVTTGEKAADFTAQMLDPRSMAFGELLSTANKAAQPVYSAIKDKVASVLPSVFKVFAKVPESATATLLQNKGVLPEATKEATNDLTNRVQEAFSTVKNKAEVPEVSKVVKEDITAKVQRALKDAVSKHGQELNAAKSEVGLPTTIDDKIESLKKYGNEFGISSADLMKTDKGEPFASPSYKWEDQGNQQYYRLFGDKDKILKITKGENGLYSDISDKTIQKHEIPIKEHPALQNSNSPGDLAVTIDNFKKNASNMPDDQRVKLASYLQNQINNKVDWSKTGSSAEGILKTQYKDLNDFAIPDSLQNSKSKMSEALDLMGDLKNKLGEEPGKAQAFLQKLFTKDTPQNQDYIKKLAKLETISGQPILSTLKAVFTPKLGPKNAVDVTNALEKHLGQGAGKAQDFLQRTFSSDKGIAQDTINQLKKLEEVSGKPFINDLQKHFASKSFSDWTSRPGLETAELAHGAIWGMLGHPVPAVGTAGVLALQSPKVLKGLVNAGYLTEKAASDIVNSKITQTGVGAGINKIAFNESNRRALQSVTDRLKNRGNNTDGQ